MGLPGKVSPRATMLGVAVVVVVLVKPETLTRTPPVVMV
jgi:hypothetical protein